MDKSTGFEFVLPVGEELPHNTFYLLHQDGNEQNLTTFTEVFADNIIRHMVDFLRGSGHYDNVIYSCMQDISKEYFDCQEKNQKCLTPDSEDLDSGSVLG